MAQLSGLIKTLLSDLQNLPTSAMLQFEIQASEKVTDANNKTDNYLCYSDKS